MVRYKDAICIDRIVRLKILFFLILENIKDEEKKKNNERGLLGQRRPNFKGISFRDERSAKMRVENK